MSMVPLREPGFFRISSKGTRNHQFRTYFSSYWNMTTLNSNSSTHTSKKEFSIQHHIPQLGTTNQLQQLDREFIHTDIFEFGQFVGREAVMDKEYWAAAWLRAESHWEDQINGRYIHNYKRKFMEQEFHALKRRCRKELNSFCMVMVNKEDKLVKSTTVKNIVGTLDVSIRHLLPGETFPGERVQAPLFCNITRKEQIKYVYISNLCVCKSARRQGLATKMMSIAINTAKAKCAEQAYVHVYRNNKPAQTLYQKMGFEVVEKATSQLSKENTYLLYYAL